MFAADVLREGDELLEINGMPIWDKTTDHLVTLMVSPAIILMYVPCSLSFGETVSLLLGKSYGAIASYMHIYLDIFGTITSVSCYSMM